MTSRKNSTDALVEDVADKLVAVALKRGGEAELSLRLHPTVQDAIGLLVNSGRAKLSPALCGPLAMPTGATMLVVLP
jgi:hypothetical protein